MVLLGLVWTSGSIVINDFLVPERLSEGLAGPQIAGVLREQIEAVVRLHRQASTDANPFDLLSSIPGSPVPKVLLAEDAASRRVPVGLALAPRATRSLNLKNLGDVKTGGLTVPIGVIWELVRAVTGWGPITVSGHLAAEDTRLVMVVDISVGRAHIVERIEGVKENGINPLLETAAVTVVYEASRAQIELDRTAFTELTRGLRRLREYEATLAQRSIQAASSHFERAFGLTQQSALAYYNRGVVAEITGNDALARYLYKAALSRDPGLLAAVLRRAVLLARSDDLETARQLLTSLARTEQPIRQVARVYLAEIAELQGEPHRALIEWRRVSSMLETGPPEAKATLGVVKERVERFAVRVTELDALVQSLLVVGRESWGSVMLQVGEEYEELGMHPRALAAYDAVVFAPHYVTRDELVVANARRGRSLFLNRRYRESLDVYRQLAKSAGGRLEELAGAQRAQWKEDPSLFVEYWIGQNYLELGQTEAAKNHLKRQLRSRPDLLEIYFALGTVALEVDRSPLTAIGQFQRVARKTSPWRMYALAEENIAAIFAQMGRYCEAARALYEIMPPPDGKLNEAAGRRLARLAFFELMGSDRRREVEDHAATALLGDPRSATAMNVLAIVGFRQGDLEGAGKWAVKAWLHGDAEERGLALWVTGRALLWQGNLTGAIEQFEWSSSLRRNDVMPRFWHAIALLRLGQKAQAAAVLRDTLKIASGDAQRRQIIRILRDLKEPSDGEIPGEERSRSCSESPNSRVVNATIER